MIAVVAVVTFFLTELFGYAIHYLAHQKWTGKLWRSHSIHHRLYSSKGLEQDHYHVSFWDSFTVWMAPAFVAIVITASFLPTYLWLTVIATMGINAIITDVIHTATHVRTHWLRRFGFVRKIVALHWIHHRKVAYNLGINTYFFDKAFKTFKR